jgi:predicted methyltransferase
VQEKLLAARQAGAKTVECSLDLAYSTTTVELTGEGWIWRGQSYPHLERCRDRTIYYWADGLFQPVARYTDSLIKLVSTPWGPPTFEIDGIKMLPTAQVSPYIDAKNKVDLIQPRDKMILDTCGGLGYFAAWCVEGGARQVLSYEKNPAVLWLRDLNPWSPRPGEVLTLTLADVSEQIASLPDDSMDAILHGPPRFGIAGELYSQAFYDQLARVLKRHGRLFHYTGSPNRLTSGRDVPNEVTKRLRHAGFNAEIRGDGVLATRR